jgi:Cu2+-exporting ATPase
VGANTTLASIAALVERAQAQRPQLVRAGDRAAVQLVWRVLALTSLTIAVWGILEPSRGFAAAVAVLVISCPCAFALAVPTAVARAIAALARRGVLVVKPDALQSLAECTHVMFDKTGTLTEATLSSAGVKTFRGASADEAWRLAAALAGQSRHPLARVICAAYPDRDAVEVCNADTHTGLGVSGSIAGRYLRLGRSDFATAGRAMPSGFEDAVLLADDDGPIAAFSLSESLRAEARTAVGALREQGLTMLIASGDAHARVANVAVQLGLHDYRARLLPADKLAWLTQLRAGGARVLAVGDGVNDAPVLAGADVSIALADGAELAQTSSDIVLSGGRLDAIAPARAIAQQTLRIIRQNQRWALFYNFTAVPLAAMGLVPPWLAAIGMSASSLAVILNALRIGRGAVVSKSSAPPLARRQLSGARLEAT